MAYLYIIRNWMYVLVFYMICIGFHIDYIIVYAAQNPFVCA